MSGYRLDKGGRETDRETPLSFRFDGKTVSGLAGDTVASALLASGARTIARSFKYHRARGIMSAGAEEASALLTIGQGARRDPNARATMTELREGLEIASQNCWPSPRFDLMAINQLGGKLLNAGFYYKTFMGPSRRAWQIYEHVIRRAAGLGHAPKERDPDHYTRETIHCDVLVVGSGPAGLSAALSAAQAGADVVLAEEQAQLGGWLRGTNEIIAGKDGHDWVAKAATQLQALDNVRLLPRTTVWGYYDDNTLSAVETVVDEGHAPRQRTLTLYAEQVILACGALERPIVFPNNDRPGIMLAGAIRDYALRWGVAAGRQVSIFTAHDEGWRVARDLIEAGVRVNAVIDPRPGIAEPDAAALAAAGVQIFAGHQVVASKGQPNLIAIAIAPTGRTKPVIWLEADVLGVSGGYTPRIALASQGGGSSVFDETIGAYLCVDARQNWTAAGSMTGAFDTANALKQGHAAGLEAARAFGLKTVRSNAPKSASNEPSRPAEVGFRVRVPGKAFVDLQHDVTVGDMELAVREGYANPEHLKRYTTLGMAADQGATANVNTQAILSELTGKPMKELAPIRFRPPAAPVALGAIAAGQSGQHLRPVRRTPMHTWHIAQGAEMVATGLWMRPRAYLRAGETMEDAYVREARHVRAAVGFCDVSTLGKIDIQGPDAAALLDRLYTGKFSSLAVGKAKYGLMLREDGFVFDDGTSWRLGEHRFLMTTTTANAATVLAHMEFLLATTWRNLKVHVASVTDEWAGIAVAGPQSRALMQVVIPSLDFSNDAFPIMGIREAEISGMPVRVARLSFSGEQAYEVFCGAAHGQAVWDRLLADGAEFDLQPYGIEALGTLRIEKGHVAGAELDGHTTPADLGLSRMMSKRKPFVGSVLAQRAALNSSERKQLVGIISDDGQPVRNGAHIVCGDDAHGALPSLGHVTSMTYSPAVEAYIALALVEKGRARIGERLYAADRVRGTHGPVRLVDPVFFDPDGERMHG